MRKHHIILSATAGVRLIQTGTAPCQFEVDTLRNGHRIQFPDLAGARLAFDAEVEASRADPSVGRYVK